MKIYSRLAAIPVCILLLQLLATAQKQPANQPMAEQQQTLREQSEIDRRRESDINRRESDLRRVGSLNTRQVPATNVLSAEQQARNAERVRETIGNWIRTKQMVQPPKAYYERFAELLKNRNIQLARLFVERNCGEGKVVEVKEIERCEGVPPIEGGGSLYSFRVRENFTLGRNWWDIHFVKNRFVVGNEAVQTIIADIGKVHLLDVNSKAESFVFLRSYKPAQKLSEIKQRQPELEKGIEANGYTYSNSVAVNFDSTYVLRTIAYYVDEESQWSNVGRGLDLLIAFKVVGREKDGSLVILWKELGNELPRRRLK